ncbi:WD40-repeat-containing domain protein [Pelagophyceae sp. CCMP2097]|nr:WD40-repeat-containing domain protein [Pelagophyceae sp. CCMP2097]
MLAAPSSARPRGALEPKYALRGHAHSVMSLRFRRAAPGRMLLLSGDVRGGARLWDLGPRRAVAAWQAHDDAGVLDIHELDDGASFLTHARDGRIKVWDAARVAAGDADNALVRVLRTDAFHFCRCAVARPAAPHAPRAAADEAPERREDAREPSVAAPKDPISIGDAVGDGAGLPPPPRKGLLADLLSHDDDDSDAGEEPADDAGPSWTDDYYREGTIARHLVLAPSEPPECMTLWDTRSATQAHNLSPTEADRKNYGVALSAKLWLPARGMTAPPLALVGYESGDVLVWDLRRMRPRLYSKTPPKLFSSPLMGIDISDDGSTLFAGAVESAARVSRLTRGTAAPYDALLRTSCSGEHAKDGIGDLVVRPDGKLIATAGWDKRVRLFSAQPPKFKALVVLKYHDDSINALDFSPDSTLLASGSKDTKIAVWKLFPPQRERLLGDSE